MFFFYSVGTVVVVQYGAHPSAPIFTIPEAIAAKSFLLDNKCLIILIYSAAFFMKRI